MNSCMSVATHSSCRRGCARATAYTLHMPSAVHTSTCSCSSDLASEACAHQLMPHTLHALWEDTFHVALWATLWTRTGAGMSRVTAAVSPRAVLRFASVHRRPPASPHPTRTEPSRAAHALHLTHCLGVLRRLAMAAGNILLRFPSYRTVAGCAGAGAGKDEGGGGVCATV